MSATITWPGGQVVIADAHLGDPRVAALLDTLASRGIWKVSLSFSGFFQLPEPGAVAERGCHERDGIGGG